MRLKTVVVTLLAALTAYSAYWYYMAENAESYLSARAEVWAQSGFELKFAKATVSGFPYRIVIALGEPHIKFRQGDILLDLRPDDLSIVVQPWTFDHALFFASKGSFTIGKEGPSANQARHWFSDGQASVRLIEGNIRRLSWEAKNVRLTTSGGVIVLNGPQFHIRKPDDADGPGSGLLEPAILNIAFSTGRIFLDGKEDEIELFDNLSLLATPRGQKGFSITRKGLQKWRDGGGTLELENLAVNWSDGGLSSTGSLTLDEELRPLGVLSLEVKDPLGFVLRLRRSGQFTESTLMRISQSVRAIVNEGKSRPLNSPLSLQSGTGHLGSHEIFTLSAVIGD